MDVVEQFLAARREKRGEDAHAFLDPKATLGTVWGYQEPQHTKMYLRDENEFVWRSYLSCKSWMKQIDENTVMRVFHFNRNIHDHNDSYGWWIHKWREVYFVKDGKIQLVSCFRQPHSIWDFWLFNSLW